MLRTQLCSKIAAKYKATSATKIISVSHCHPSPWLVVKESDNTTRRDKKRRMTGWLECVISCLVAMHGYLARLDGVDIELLRPSSFGFLEPNVVAMSDSIRISPGLLNCSPSESDLLTLALNVTNDVVGSYRISSDHFRKTMSSKRVIGGNMSQH